MGSQRAPEAFIERDPVVPRCWPRLYNIPWESAPGKRASSDNRIGAEKRVESQLPPNALSSISHDISGKDGNWACGPHQPYMREISNSDHITSSTSSKIVAPTKMSAS